MIKLKRLRRREVLGDVHSEDEEEFDATRGELELSDLSDSEASCEDSDIESEASHSEGEEETQETNIVKEEATTKEELSPTKEEFTKSINEDTNFLSETSIENISEAVTKSKVSEGTVSTNKQEPEVDGQLDIKQKENDSITVNQDSDLDVVSTDGEELQSHSGNENEMQHEKNDDSQNSVNTSEIPLTDWQKKLLARQEYRKKLAEDPAFVPHIGEFWGHDDRFIKDELKNDFDSRHRKPLFASRGKGVWGNSPPRGRWDHDGFQELMRIEDEERNKKEFQRRIHHREFVPPASRRRSHNIAPTKFNHSRPSNFSIGTRRSSFEEKPRSRGMFSSMHDTKNREGNFNSDNFSQNHKPNLGESRSENSHNGDSGNITSSRFNDNKASTGRDSLSMSRGRNGFRGRGYSSRHYMRSNLNRDHSNQADNEKVNGKNNIDQDKSKEQHLNDGVDNTKDLDVVHNSEHNEGRDNESEDHKNTVAENQIEKVESAQDLTDMHITSSSSTREEIESGSSIKEQERSYGGSNEESEVEIILDPQSKKAAENNEIHSINNVTSSFNDLSINNNDQHDAISSTSTEKDRVQASQASKRYSTRRAASSQTNESLVSRVSDNSRTSEIPPSAVFAPPFQPRALALSDENSIPNEDTPNNFLLQKPETPISYYTDNLSQGLRNNLSCENNLPHPTPVSYGTESNGMVYYYDPNMYYYFYPTHTIPVESKNTNDNSVKSSFVTPPPNTVQENNGVYYYYHPVYYQ